jgi:hypothetical protein
VPLMLYRVPEVSFGQELLTHTRQTMAEENALKQARVANPFPVPRRVNQTIRLKNGKTLSPRGLSWTYARKSTPYLSRRQAAPQRAGLAGITDFFSGIGSAITGTVSAVTGTVAGVAGAAKPLEQVLTENPSLVNLIRSYVAPPQASAPVTVIPLSPAPQPVLQQKTLGVSNMVWVAGAAGLGGLALIRLMGRK